MPDTPTEPASPRVSTLDGNHESQENEGDDHIEFILLDCYQRLLGICPQTLEEPTVLENIHSLYFIASRQCTHSGQERIASLYYIRKNLRFREIRLCRYCYNNANTCLNELVQADPFNSFVGFFASIGRVTAFYRYVLII